MKRFVLTFIITVIMVSALGCSNDEIITNNTINQVLVKPEKYLKNDVVLTGKLIGPPEKKDDYEILSLAPNPSNPQTKIKVIVKGYEGKLVENNFVTIEGILEDEGPTIRAKKVDKIKPQDFLAPTVKEQIFNLEENQNGYIITLDKIEFAEKESRIFVTVRNETKKDIAFYSDYAQVLQKTKDDKEIRYKQQKNWEADYQEVPTEIEPEVETWGIIVFESLDYELKSAIITFEGFSEERYIKPFEFYLEW